MNLAITPVKAEVHNVKPQITYRLQSLINQGTKECFAQFREHMNYYDMEEASGLVGEKLPPFINEIMSLSEKLKKEELKESVLKILKKYSVGLSANEENYFLGIADIIIFVKKHIKIPQERKIVFDEINKNINKEMTDEIQKVKKMALYNTSKKAEEIFALELRMDRLDKEINNLLEEAGNNGQKKLTQAQKTKYTELATKYNKCLRIQKRNYDAYQIMKASNFQTGREAGMEDFFRQYAFHPYKINDGKKRFEYYGNLSMINNKTGVRAIDNPDITERLIVDSNNKLLARRTVDNKGVCTTKIYDENGNVKQISKYDQYTKKFKMVKK